MLAISVISLLLNERCFDKEKKKIDFKAIFMCCISVSWHSSMVDKHSVLRKKKTKILANNVSCVWKSCRWFLFFVDSISISHKIYGSQEGYEQQMLSWMKFPLYLHCEKLRATAAAAAAAVMAKFDENQNGLLWKRLCSLLC